MAGEQPVVRGGRRIPAALTGLAAGISVALWIWAWIPGVPSGLMTDTEMLVVALLVLAVLVGTWFIGFLLPLGSRPSKLEILGASLGFLGFLLASYLLFGLWGFSQMP